MLAVIVAAGLLFSWLDVVPGLHGDEAWVGLRAYAISHGERPMTGMNSYTGAFYSYLVAPLVGTFGNRVFALRLLTALAALVTVTLYHRAATKLFDPGMAAFATVTLVTLPFFTAFGRLAGENFALNPILAVGAIVLLLESSDGPVGRRMVLAFLSGVCLGLGTWNHAIFISVPIALAAAALHRYGRSLISLPATYMVCAGYVLALIPRGIIQLWLPAGGAAALPPGAAATYLDRLLNRLYDWPALFLGMAHGDVLFQRFAGELRWWTPNLVAPLAAVGVVVMWKRQKAWSGARAAVVFGGALFVSTLLICPGNSERYFLLILYVVPLFIAAAFVQLSALSPFAGLSHAAFAVFVCLQLTRTGVNYFVSQERSHGRASSLMFGRQGETSDHFMRTDGLYRRLVSLGATQVVAEFFIAEPLQFYDLEQRHFASVSIEDAMTAGTTRHPAGSYVVLYSDRLRPSPPEQYRKPEWVYQDSQFVVGKLP